MSRSARSLLAVCLALRFASADEFTAPLYDFLSRPDIRTPRLEVDAYDPSGVAPGHIFLTPAARTDISAGVNFNFGPTIYDNNGELVWSGYNPALPKQAESMGFDVTQFHNKPHLTYGTIGVSDMSHGDILDENYQLVRQATVGRTRRNTLRDLRRDMHVFNVITPRTLALPLPLEMYGPEFSSWVRQDDPETALISATTVKHIWPPAEVCGQRISWIRDFPWQEVSLDGSNEVLFEWNPLDHIPIEETLICPGMKDHPDRDPERIGSGPGHPFDFVHRNAVDKLPDGDFVVSARHMNTIYRISRVDGHIIWRLGGVWTDFNQTSLVSGVGFEFTGQHDIRVANDVPGADPANGIIGLTLWDNANVRFDAVGASSDRSVAKTILVDQHHMTAVLVSAYSLPGNPLGVNQGSHQLLPNGNHMIGGGNIAQIAEYRGHSGVAAGAAAAAAGAAGGLSYQEPLVENSLARPVFAAHFGGGPMNSYRARRYEWRGFPLTKPDAFAYRRSCSVAAGNRTFVYASWNGATEVAAWTVRGAPTRGAADRDFRDLATARRTGFETAIAVHHDGGGGDGHDGWEEGGDAHQSQVLEVYVVALDAEGRELDRSERVAVWVPRGEDLIASRRADYGSSARRGREERHRGGGDCGERRCRRGFEYPLDRAMECGAASSTASAWWF